MTTTLQMHSYDVYDNYGNCIGRHTGYNLVTINDDGTKIIERIDLYRDGTSGLAQVSISNNEAKEVTFINKDNPLETQKAYWDSNITPELIQHYNYYNSDIILSGDDARNAYNKIKLDAALSNFVGLDYDLGFPIVNDGRVCNTATNYWGEQYIPNFDNNIYNSLPDGTLGGYYGHSDDYINATDYNQAQKIKFIKNLITILDENGSIDDILSDTAPFISDKYLSILEPFLKQELLSTGDSIPITDLLIGIFQGVINLLDIKYFTKMLQITSTITDLYHEAGQITSPLIVDLDGDGVETTTVESGIHFDHDANGFAEKSAWVGKDDGLLVRDINGNGQIDNGTELFGNNTLLSNGQKAANGFEALKDLDSNGDGVFDNQDTAWNEVKVWKDANANGVVDDGELLTLEQAGISSFDLNYQSQSIDDANGNAHLQTSTLTKSDGTTANVTDVWFNTDTVNSIDTTQITIPDDIKAMPDIAGFGNVHSLHIAMALDETGKLKEAIEKYAAETDKEKRAKILDEIIYRWAGVQDEDPRGRDPSQVYGPQFDDCRQLEALEEFMGQDYLGTWCWGWGERDPNPHGQAAPYLIKAYNILKNYVDLALLSQTHYKTTLENIPLIYDAETEKWTADASSLLAEWEEAFETNSEQVIAQMKEFYTVLSYFGDNAIPVINAIQGAGSTEGNTYQNELLYFGQWENSGTDGNDFLEGDDNNNYLDGGKGDDSLFGFDGDDFLVGGEGNDYLVGGNGDDTYYFAPGFGNDSIDNLQDESQPNNDIIRFGTGISPNKVTLNRQGFDLIISVAYEEDENGDTRPNDTLRIYSYFNKQGTTSTTVSKIIFSDEEKTTWNYEYVRDHWNDVPDVFGGVTREGNNEDNSLEGTYANDVLIGNGGNDVMYGVDGNDIFYGGKGNDIMNGGAGSDTYLWNWGDGLDTINDNGGHDKISFGEGIRFEDLSFSLVSGYQDLKITVKGNETQGIIIRGQMGRYLPYKIEDLYFHDGTIVHLSEIPLTLRQNSSQREYLTLSDNGDTLYAGSGDDYIEGGMGDDVITAGKGWDVINGGQGQNTYIWNLGDGFDTITCDYNSDDTIKFGAGITFENLRFRLEQNTLTIHINGDETQGMEVIRREYLHYLKFADGTVVDLTQTPLTYHQHDAEENSIQGNDLDNTYYCGGGNDTITGGRGNDTFIGGRGNDYLSGWEGDDTYVWNLGDGLDTISDSSGTNIIQFGEGISFEDLTFEKADYDWRIYVKGNRTQGMKFYQCQPHILKFADGTSYDLREHGLNLHNSDNNDDVYGTDRDDIVFGGGGNDSIAAFDGNDILSGGKGDDMLNGGDGDDTYIWNLGDGFDTISDSSGNDKIKFGKGITLADLSFARHPNGNLEIYVKGERSQGISIYSHFNSYEKPIETLEFADGTTFDLSNNDIDLVDYQGEVIDNQYEEMTEMNGSDGADIMTNRYDYSVTFNGGKGNDTFTGGSGADTYIYNLGDGLDYIYDDSNDNTIKFGEGISYSDLSFRTTYSGELTIFVDEARTQGIRLSNSQIIKYLEFADGTIVNFHETSFAVHQDNKDEDLEINDSRFTHLYMGDGDSRVYNRSGHDMVIYSGKGNDEIRGDYGANTLVWNRGDGVDRFVADYNDVIRFGAGITADDLTFRSDNSGLHIIVDGDESQGITLANYNPYNPNELKHIYFADGSHINLSNGLVWKQTNADDSLSTGGGNHIVYAGGGNDTIQAESGDDILIGGTGNDTLYGGYGDDTYIYNLGDGFDTINDEGGNDKIKFGNGISLNDLQFSKDGYDLKITINGDDSSGMLIKHQFENIRHEIESLEFQDGLVLDISDANELIQAMNGFNPEASSISDFSQAYDEDGREIYALAHNHLKSA